MRKTFAILVLCGGLAAGLLLVVAYDLDAIGAALGAADWSGFATICAVHAVFIALLGAAWWALVPHASPLTFIWARLIRDAGADLLPLSQVGGYAMGARAATLRGVPAQVAIASTVVDVTLGYKLPKQGLTISGTVANLLDSTTPDVLGAPIPHRFAWLQVAYDWNGLR